VLIGALKRQGDMTLREYVTSKHKNEISLVEYVYTEHRDTLDRLTRRNKIFVNKMLEEVNIKLCVHGGARTSTDYAIQYLYLDSIYEVENCINKIKELLFISDPFA
jgi:hypothetical protein